MILDLPYIRLPDISGDTIKDAGRLLAINNRGATLAHCVGVAETCAGLAEKFGLDRENAYLSGIMHDISAVIKPEDMMRYAKGNKWCIDECEKRYNFILHQRASAAVARDYFGISNREILSAIECHSTLRAKPSGYDMALFVADKLSWDQEGIPPFYGPVRSAADTSLAGASLAYIDYAIEKGMILYPHKWLLEARDWLEDALEH